MPLLNSEAASRADEAHDQELENAEPLPEGLYRLRLVDVTESEVGQSRDPKLVGCPQWAWAFDVVEPDEHAGRRVVARRVLPADNGYQHADFLLAKFGEPFRAFGVALTTDTDELVGQVCRGYLTQFPFKSGDRAGQIGNSIEDLLPDAPLTDATVGDDDYDF